MHYNLLPGLPTRPFDTSTGPDAEGGFVGPPEAADLRAAAVGVGLAPASSVVTVAVATSTGLPSARIDRSPMITFSEPFTGTQGSWPLAACGGWRLVTSIQFSSLTPVSTSVLTAWPLSYLQQNVWSPL